MTVACGSADEDADSITRGRRVATQQPAAVSDNAAPSTPAPAPPSTPADAPAQPISQPGTAQPPPAACAVPPCDEPKLDLGRQWRVQPARTEIAATRGGQAWDAGDDATPDVMVFIDCSKDGFEIGGAPALPKFAADARTGESSTLKPMWSTIDYGTCTIKGDDLLERPLLFRVFDNDSGLFGLVSEPDAITGVLSHQVTRQELASGTFSIPPQGHLAAPLEIKLIPTAGGDGGKDSDDKAGDGKDGEKDDD